VGTGAEEVYEEFGGYNYSQLLEEVQRDADVYEGQYAGIR